MWQCVGTNYEKMAIENPDALIAIKDSIALKGLTSSSLEALTLAHNNVGLAALKSDNYQKARQHFSQALQLSTEDTVARYNLLITEAHIKYKKGNKDGLWDAIQKYNKASFLKPSLGEPHYYIGLSYLKLSDTDFDLILESYEKALLLDLNPVLRAKVESQKSQASDRKNRLKEFWN